MTTPPPHHHHEVMITATNSKGETSSVPLELASHGVDTPQKAAEAAASILAANHNGGMGKFTRVSDQE